MVDLEPRPDALGDHGCARCGGAHLPSPSVGRLLREELALDPAILQELPAVVAKKALPCADCGEEMASLSLRGAGVDFCSPCGALWLDGGELHRLTAGRHGEPRNPTERPEAASSRARDAPAMAGLYEPGSERSPETEPAEVRSVSSDTRRALIVGVGLAVLVYIFPFSRFVLSYLGILVHEMGHAAGAWLFGHPAIPSFDFLHGGGVTAVGERSTPVVLMIYGLLSMALWRLREHPPWSWIAATLVAVYTVLSFTRFPELFWVALGHGMELIIAGVFLFRALSGRAIRIPVERPLYVACALFLVLENIDLAWGLMHSPEARELYSLAAGLKSCGDGDLTRLGRDFLGVSLPAVASGLLLASLATPLLSLWLYRYGAVVRRRISRLLTLPDGRI